MTLATGFLLALSIAGRVNAEAELPGESRHVATPAELTRKTISAGFDLEKQSRIADAEKAFDQAIRSGGFAQLPVPERNAALVGEADTADELGDHARSHVLWTQLSETPSASTRDVWHNRLATAYGLKDFVDSAHCVATIAPRWPEELRQMPGSFIREIRAGLGDSDEADRYRFELYDALYRASWKDDTVDASSFWRDFSRLLLARHDVAKAKQVAAGITSPRIALSMLVDLRFDAITSGNPVFDVEKLEAAALERARLEAATHPEKLALRVELLSTLLDSMRYEEALKLADGIVATVGEGKGPRAFVDFDSHYNWILDDRERALIRLGRVDDAVVELERAAHQSEQGDANVSQAINLGDLYDQLGRPHDALAAVSRIGRMSPYGLMQLECVRLWAAIQLHDSEAIDRHMAYMRAHRADAMNTWDDALVLDGQEEEAASDLITRLRDDRSRTAALVSMQTYGDVRRPPLEAMLVDKWRRIHARPDVREAALRVGRLVSVRIDPGDI